MSASDGLSDKFYTRESTVRYVVSVIDDIASYPHIVEPSAGNGAFMTALPDTAAFYDIEPEREGIIKSDWFDVKERFDGGLLVGNPPFGKRSSLAKRFISHGISLGFETIAFILPQTFQKLTTQKVFPSGWSLTKEVCLADDVFIHEKGQIRIPCVFQVWTKRPSPVNLRKTNLPQPKEFEFLPRNDERADLCLNGNSGKVRKPSEITNPKAEHFIKVREGGDNTTKRLSTLPLSFSSSVSGGVAWVSKAEIIEAWVIQGEQHLLHRG